MKKTIAKVNKTNSWFFEKIIKTHKPLARLIKKKRERAQSNKFRNGKGEVQWTPQNTKHHERLLQAIICQ